MNEPSPHSTSHYARRVYQSIGLLIVIILISSSLIYIHSITAANNTTNHSNTAYIDNQTCLQCHQNEASEWRQSHHANAMKIANADTVLGNFDQTTFVKDTVTTTFFKKNNEYIINTQGPDGKFADFKVAYTFGVDPIQQYLILLPGGRLQNFTIAWDVKKKRWFDLYPTEKTPPGDTLHWTGRYQNANMMCIGCHTTNFNKNYDAKSDSYHSTWSDLGVNCQACHGPGENHIYWAKHPSNDPHKGLINPFTTKDKLIDTCAICHSRRSELTTDSGVGDAFMNHFLPALLTEGLYYPDGQQQSEVYVYDSFKQSKMYQAGVTCIDCHHPHTGKLKQEGNAVCTQCHSPEGDKRFPSAAKLYDDPSHTFHPKGSPGAACVSCHMPAKNYMQIHSRPDHSIRIPRPDLSVKLGTPNACTTCHTDKSAKWASEWIIKWHGNISHNMHYGEILAAARNHDSTAETALANLINDNSVPTMIRATALNALNQYGTDMLNLSLSALHDQDPLIRHASLSSLEKLPLNERVASITPLLSDPMLAVRMEAARLLAGAPLSSFNENDQAALKKATDELIASNTLSLDMPGANLNLAVLNENLGNRKSAESYYLNALRIDPAFTPARLNLATLYNQSQQNNKAIETLNAGIHETPTQGEFYYALGLIYAEEKELKQASDALKQASTLMPKNLRIRYNYSLILLEVGEKEKSLHELLALVKQEPNNGDYLYALINLYVQMERWDDALLWANKLSAINPNNPQIKLLIDDIRNKELSR